MGYTLTLDDGKIQMVVGPMTKGAVEKATDAARNYARAGAPVHTGRLRDSIVSVVERRGFLRHVGTVFTHNEYAWFQERGTRAHGPVRAQYLRFKPKGSGTYVFAKWVRGVPATHFMQRALEQLSLSDFL